MARAAVLARAKTDCSGASLRGAGGPGLALPFVRAGNASEAGGTAASLGDFIGGTATCSIWVVVTAFMANKRITMATAWGRRRLPDLHRLMCLGLTPNSRAAWRCVMSIASSVSRNSVADADRAISLQMTSAS